MTDHVADDHQTRRAERLHGAEPFADWPKDEVAAADERTTLIGFLYSGLATRSIARRRSVAGS